MKYLSQLAILLVIFMAHAMAQWQRCVGRPWIASCNQAPHCGRQGAGCAARVMWWYDRNLRYCRQMWYSGCGGNSNRWCSRAECERRCRR